MTRTSFLVIDGKPYRWKDILHCVAGNWSPPEPHRQANRRYLQPCTTPAERPSSARHPGAICNRACAKIGISIDRGRASAALRAGAESRAFARLLESTAWRRRGRRGKLRPIPANAAEPQIAPQARQCNRAFRYCSATAALASLRTSLCDHGFEVNRTPSGRTMFEAGLPDVTRTSTWGQYVFTSLARSIPSIGPGVWTSVNRKAVCSERCATISRARSALCTHSTSKPAARNISSATMRRDGSSSTTSTVLATMGVSVYSC